VLSGVVLASLAGCATYRPLPLPEAAPAPVAAPPAAQVLSMAQIERRVLRDNPDLRSARAQHAVAQAQMLQASLLPNPSLSGSAGYLLSGVGDATAWTAGISENIQALVTLRPRRDAARAQAAQVDAGLLWDEWQVIGKARLLVVDIVEDERLLAVQQAALQRHADFWADKIAPRLSGTLQSFYIQLMFWSEFQSSVVGPPFSDTWLSARLEQFSLVSMPSSGSLRLRTCAATFKRRSMCKLSS